MAIKINHTPPPEKLVKVKTKSSCRQCGWQPGSFVIGTEVVKCLNCYAPIRVKESKE